jgi:hypothetical protein
MAAGIAWPVVFDSEMCRIFQLDSFQYDRCKEVAFYMFKKHPPTKEGVQFFDALYSLKRAVNWNELEGVGKLEQPWKDICPKMCPKSSLVMRRTNAQLEVNIKGFALSADPI